MSRGKTNLASATLFQTKLFLYTSCTVGAGIPMDMVLDASFLDTQDHYNYFRIDARRGFDYAIFAGEDHEAAQADKTNSVYARLDITSLRLAWVKMSATKFI